MDLDLGTEKQERFTLTSNYGSANDRNYVVQYCYYLLVKVPGMPSTRTIRERSRAIIRPLNVKLRLHEVGNFGMCPAGWY